MFSAIHSVVLVLAASAPAGLPQGSVSQAPNPKRTTLLSAGFVSKKHLGTLVRFGPKGCVSTWLNDQARCMIKTECAEKDVDNYNFKFICVDESGEHVRHVFGKGSFDPEETFDTLVTCTSCTADADDLLVSAKQGTGDSKTKTNDDGPKSTNAVLRQIAADVGELKVEIANATQNVERLNAVVFKESTFPPPHTSTPKQAETTPAPSSLVHSGVSILRTRGKTSRLRAIKAHAQASKSHTHKIRRRHAEYDVDTADQDAVFSEEDARNQDSSSEQDDAQDLDDMRRQDEHDDQEDDDAERMDQDDVNDSDFDYGQHDDEHGQHDDEHGQRDDDEQHDDEHDQHDDQHDQARADDRSADSNNGEDARDMDEDGDWHRKDNTD